MNETDATAESAESAGSSRIYEIGYMIVPRVVEDELEKVVGSIRSEIEKAGGHFIAEGAPSSTKLAYAIVAEESGKKSEYDRAYFGWVKFEAPTFTAQTLSSIISANPLVLRSILFQTVREDTRAKMKAPTLREVRRTDTIRSAPRRTGETEEKGPVSEEELEKAISEITSEQ